MTNSQRHVCVVLIVLVMTMLLGCENRQQRELGFPANIARIQFRHAIEQYSKTPTAENLVEVCKWCWSSEDLMLGEYRDKDVTIEMNGVRVELFAFSPAINTYVETLLLDEGKFDSREIAVLRGMLVIGEALERRHESLAQMVGMIFEEKALPFVIAWAQSRGDRNLERRLEQAKAELQTRFCKLKQKRLREVEKQLP